MTSLTLDAIAEALNELKFDMVQIELDVRALRAEVMALAGSEAQVIEFPQPDVTA